MRPDTLLLGSASPEDHFTNFDPERPNHGHDQHQEPVLTAERGRLEDVLHEKAPASPHAVANPANVLARS